MPTKERVKKDKLLVALENGGETVKRMFTVSNDLSANIGIYRGNFVGIDAKGEPNIRDKKPKSEHDKANALRNLEAANAKRKSDSAETAKKVQAGCTDIWGKNDKTHVIQQRAKDIGVNVTARTIRSYKHKI